MNKFISIIVPIYNVKSLLKRCIDSIKCQTYSDFEVLLIDDGSTDGSGELADSLAENLDNFFVFHKKNGGLSDARNYGMTKAKGDCYLFVDSDDVLHKDFCKVLIEAMNHHDADIVSTDLIEFSLDEELDALNNTEYPYQENVYKKEEILKEYFVPADNDKRKIYHGMCMKLFRRQLFDNLFFEKGKLHEDVFMTYRVLDRSDCFVYIDLPYYYYFQQNLNSISNNYGKKNFLDEYEAIDRIKTYFKGRKKIHEELVLFCVYHYLSMLHRIYHVKDKEISQLKRKMCCWGIRNTMTLKSVSFKKKCKMLFGLLMTEKYFELRGKKNESK